MTALIFDLDDTLFDQRLAMERFLRGRFDLQGELLEDALRIDQRGKGPRAPLCELVAEAVGLSASDVWATLQADLGGYATPIAPAVLVAAAERFEVAVLTNGGGANQRAKARAIGVERVVGAERIFVSAEIGSAKPSAAAFSVVLDALGVAAADAVFVGDDPRADIAGGRAVGLRTCWVARGRGFPDTPPPDWTIDSIEDLPRVWDRFRT